MAQTALATQSRGTVFDARGQLAIELAYWSAWAVTGIWLLAAADAVRGSGRPVRTMIAAMLCLAALAVTSQPFLDTAILLAEGSGPRDVSAKALIERKLIVNLMNNVQIVIALIGVSLAAQFYARYRERDRAAQALEGQLAAARLDALRSQLDPHFLFNSLNAIAMLARKGSPKEVVKMLTGLSDLLRDTLDDGRPQRVTLARELEFIQRYLEIEQVRFQNRLRVAVSASPATLAMLVPSFILQPLVENAVRHGLDGGAAAGTVAITATLRDRNLVVDVRDNGAGIREEVRRDGIGLRNSRARLQELYGDRASLELTTHDEGGALAIMTLPAEPAADSSAR